MEYNEFSNLLKENMNNIGVDISEQKTLKFYNYMNMLLEWNEKIYLTAIVEPKEIILKHFVDSATIEKYFKLNSKIIDIGTGAGFPGIPINIIRDDLDITLMDSLNKRINFLDKVIDENHLKNIDTIHARAEELARNENHREKYDIATSRAVASLNVLLEYMMPFVKVGGYCICMKGSNIDQEIKDSGKALTILNGKIEKIDNFILPGSDYNRSIILIKKIGETPKRYPRKSGTPSKEPLK